jgi:hypothetical protein
MPAGPRADKRHMRVAAGVEFGLFALPAGLGAGIAFAGGVNLHYHVNGSWLGDALVLGAIACGLGTASLVRFGVPSRRAWKISLVVLAAWTAAFFAYAWATFPSTSTAAHRDRPVLRTVPVYPGATFSGESFAGVESSDGGEGFLTPPLDYETTWTWRPPRGVRFGPVAAWYERRLRAQGWGEISRDDSGVSAGVVRRARANTRWVSIVVAPAQRVPSLSGGTALAPAEIVATASADY